MGVGVIVGSGSGDGVTSLVATGSSVGESSVDCSPAIEGPAVDVGVEVELLSRQPISMPADRMMRSINLTKSLIPYYVARI
jgi:hypothetical protein